MDANVNGQIQHEWKGLIAIYLFLGGVGSGAYTIAAINSFLGKSMELSTAVGLWIGFPALLIGSLFLLADLGSPTRFLLAGMKPGSSWIARGFWIISLFMLFAFLHLVLHRFTGMDKSGIAMNVIAGAGILFAILTMAYTGLLLGASKGIPFWRTGAIPVVFVVSAVVTGHFSIMLGMIIFQSDPHLLGGLNTMAGEAIALVLLEILAIWFFLQAAFRQPDSRESAERILQKRLFVFGYLVAGLLLPLTLMMKIRYQWFFAMKDSGDFAALTAAFVGALLGLAGGLLLRLAILICGALPTLNISGFQFRRIARPKDPKPEIGLLPPGERSVAHHP